MMDESNALSDLDQLRSRYDVLRQLGRDGAAAVYATRSRGGDRHFVVKVMDHPGSGSANGGDLHLWQAQTMRPLDHPKLMALHAVHHLQDGAVAVAMERRRGQTLAERMEAEGPLPSAEAEQIVRDVAEALAYLQGRGIVHRGVRPESIFLDRDAGHARLAPFGLEREENPRPGAWLAYMAPEVINGKGEVDDRRWSARGDLYALGMVGYAMLTGAPRTASDAPLVDARRDAPDHLCATVERCLATNPRHRWKGAEELLAALDAENAVGGQPSVMERITTGFGSGVHALREVLGEQPNGATRVRVAVALSTAVIGVVAVAILWGSGPAAPVDRNGATAAAARMGTAATAPAGEAPVTIGEPARHPPRPSILTVEDLGEERMETAAPATVQAAAPPTPVRRVGRPPLRGAEFSDGGGTSTALVLLGEPIRGKSSSSSSDLLGKPLGR